MSISSQLPPIPLAQASATLRTLAQAAGQTVEAKVLGQLANGATQVQIGRLTLSLNLPAGQPAGTMLTLSVQQAEGQLRLALISARPAGSGAPVTAAPVAGNGPATSVQLSSAALSSAGAGRPAPPASALTVGGNISATPGTTAPVGSLSVGPAQTPTVAAPAGAVQAPGSGVLPIPPGGTAAPAAPTALPQAVSPGAAIGGSAPNAVAGGPAGAAPMANSPASGPAFSPAAGNAGAAAMPAGAGNTPPVRSAIPYAVAAPAGVPPPVASLAGSAATALPPVAQALSSSLVGQHAPSPQGATGVPVQAGQAAPTATIAAPMASIPQAALNQMVHQALPRQNSVAGLMTALTAIAGKVPLPGPVIKAAQQALGLRLPLDTGLDGAAIKVAVRTSGLFQEALLAAGQGKPAAADLKSALMGLQRSLGAWLGNQGAVEQTASVAPPMRGQVPRARAGEAPPPDMPSDPVDVGKILLERTEAALSRLRLHQNASLPEPGVTRPDSQWSLDLPVTLAGQQQVLHLQIHHDAEGEAGRPEDRGWQLRFAINLPEMGEVGAQISLRAKTTGVLLWADRPETAAALEAHIEQLSEDLAGLGLVPGALVVRAGAPATPMASAGAESGHYVDARR